MGVQKQKWRKRQQGGEKKRELRKIERDEDDGDDLKGGQERRERADGLLDVQSVSTLFDVWISPP